jgi:hypothetical protein
MAESKVLMVPYAVVAPKDTCESDTLLVLQLIVAPDDVIALEVTPEMVRGATREILVRTDDPLSVAVRVAVWSEVTTLVLAVKVPEAAFAPIVTEAGMLNAADAVLDSATVLPAVGLERVTVQVVLAFDTIVAAAHWRLDRVTGVTGATSESTVDLEEPFEAAVIVAD